MALTGTDRGTGSRNTGGESTYTASPGSTIAAGSFGVWAIAADNSGASGAHPISAALGTTITDSVGNKWTLAVKRVQTPGSAANDGVSLTIYECPYLVTALTSSDSITATFDQTTVARAHVFHEITTDDSTKFVAAGRSTQIGTSGTSTSPSSGALSIASGKMGIGFMAAEHNSAITADSDTTNGSWSTQQTAGVGTTTGGVEIASQRKIVTSTGNQTYNLTITSADWTVSLRVYEEVAVSTRTATVAGSGTIASNGYAARARTATVAGAGAIDGSGYAARDRGATVVGSGALTASGVRVASRSASAAGTGVLLGAGYAVRARSGSIDGSGALASSGVRVATRSADLGGTGQLDAAGIRTTSSSGTLAGTGTLDAVGIRTATTGASLAATGTLTATGVRIASTTASIAGSGAASAAGVRSCSRGATIAGTGSASGSGLRTAHRGATITGTGAAAANGYCTRERGATITATGTLIAVGGIAPKSRPPFTSTLATSSTRSTLTAQPRTGRLVGPGRSSHLAGEPIASALAAHPPGGSP